MSTTLENKDGNIQSWITDQFDAYVANLNGHSQSEGALFRKAAFQELQNSRFPNRRDEDWKYTNFNKALKQSYIEGELLPVADTIIDKYSFDELDSYLIIFINGKLHTEIDHERFPIGLKIETIDEVLSSSKDWINDMLSLKGGTDQNAFIPLNKSFAKNGFVITSEKNTKVERPVHFMFLNTEGSNPHISHPQLFVKGSQGSEFTIIESHHCESNDTSYFTNSANWVDVDDNAHVHHYRLQLDSKSANNVNNTIVKQGRDSIYSSYAVDFGGKLVRNNLSSELTASGTNTNYFGVYLGNSNQHIDNQTFIDHAMPHCESNEMYKGILDEKARGIFNGKVLVRQDAQKTNAFQQNASLVLSDTAVMDAKPQLEIYADDVKCSHGATIGQLDESSMFYLRSRGLTKPQARILLQKAFLGEVIGNFHLEPIKHAVLSLIDKKLG